MASPVAAVWAQFRLDMSDFASKLKTASTGLKSFAKQQQTILKQQNQGYSGANAIIRSFNRGLSDTVNITRGILISQTFYAAAGAIRDALGALWDFNKQLDYAQVTYTALFGDANLAKDFMAVLQEHSIETIFDYQDLAGMSKKLLAYGIEYENLMFIMEGLTNLGAMSGDSAALDRIALALGQIYTKGKLSAEEMRQLANAYVPITDIITEKFGLTGDDLKKVGDLNLPAEDVINAIVDYANKNFGSVGDAAMMTITGLQAKIVDTVKVVGAEMLQPITAAYKSFLAYISNGLEVIRTEFATGGIGGIFEYLVPDATAQANIRTFVANLKNLLSAVMSLVAAAAKWFGNFAQAAIIAFNAISPFITGFINALATVADAMVNTSTGAAVLRVMLIAAAGAFVMMKVQALGALVITAVTKAVIALSKALAVLAAIISKHPIISLIAMLGVSLIGVAAASNNANSALSGLFDTIAGAGGSSGKDVLQKTENEIEDANDALDQFNNRLEEGKENAEDFKDSINGAGSAAKKTGGLLSFDEVFKLPDSSDSSGGSGAGSSFLDDIDNILDGIGALGGGLIPDIPDFSEYFDNFTDSLLGGLGEGLKSKIAAGGWGALIGGILGALIGGAFGNPILGAKIGAAAGALAGVILDSIGYAINNSVAGVLSGIGLAISKAFGGESLIRIFKTLATGSIDDIIKSIAGIFSATGAKALLKGGLIGAAIGLVVDGIAHLLWNTLEEKFTNANAETAKVGQTIGGVIGTVIGAILGGPAGALIGSAIGTFAGGLVGLFWEPIADYFDPEKNALSAFFVELTSRIGSWATESFERLTAWLNDTYTGFSAWWTDTTSGLTTWWSDTTTGFSDWYSSTFDGLAKWWNDTVALFSDWDSINGDTLVTWWEETSTGFSDWRDGTLGGLSTWWTDTTHGFRDWKSGTLGDITSWIADTFVGWANWRIDTLKEFTWWKDDVIKAIKTWAADTWNSIATWYVDTDKKIDDWVEGVIGDFKQFKDDAVMVIAGFAYSAGLAISEWLSDTWTSFSTWFTDLAIDIKGWWDELFDITKWKSGWDSVSSWFTDLFNDMKNWFKNLGTSVSTWWDGLWDDKDISVNASATGISGGGRVALGGHATGGIFNREHIARFAEGNKAEMAVPLENASAMRPFVDAISDGIVSSIAPIVANINASSNNSLPPMYVGTLVADERGLKQLYKKFEVIKVQEDARRGVPVEVF